MPSPERYLGLMSGTSLDGVDGVLAEFSGSKCTVTHYQSAPIAPDLRAELLALNQPGPNELHRAALAGNAIALLYAQVVQALLQKSGHAASAIHAIGAHGQTVRHRPQAFDGHGYSLQLNNPALVAELTGIDVVADFRSRDVAAGGQGAPLVPAFHQSLFAVPGKTRAILNIGGMANVSLLGADGSVSGFDCGPGNVLMDLWCQRHTGKAYDADGAWAATGKMLPSLLAAFHTEPFFAQIPPKSTGRDMLDAAWLERHVAAVPSLQPLQPEDVQATLLELTAGTCAASLAFSPTPVSLLALCGGGALNSRLKQRIAQLLPSGVALTTTDTLGLPVQQVEAAAFAWLARQTINRLPGNLPKATGALGARVLGAVYPA